jgi:peptide chain release factor subunit 1
MSINEKEKHTLKKFIKELRQFKGRHTELVSVYIPAEYDIIKIINQLAQEQGTASNIKSSATRNNVTGALERMIQHLRLFKRTPEHGLVAFSGNVAEREGQTDLRVWSLEPPIKLNQKLYRCDKEFVLEPLEDMIDIKEFYGLVVLDRRDAMIALLKGKTIIPLRKTHSDVPGKMKAGGQSSQRFARLRLGAIKDHYKKVSEYMKEAFLGRPGLMGIILGGPGVTINDFLNKDYLTGDIKKLIIGTKDLSYTGEFGLQELLDRSEDILSKEEVTAEKKIMNQFFELLNTKMKKVSYGEAQVMKLLQLGMVDIVLLSETLSDELIEKFEAEAEKTGSVVRIISVETREGVQLKEMGGVAAILRYEYEEA